MIESRLRLFGHVWRRPIYSAVRRESWMKGRPIARVRGRPRKGIGEIIKKV